MSKIDASDVVPPSPGGRRGVGPDSGRARPRKRLVVKRLVVLGVWLEFVAVLVLSLVPGSERPHTGLGSGPFEHFLAYGLVGATIAIGYRATRARIIAFLTFAIGSGVFELLQTLVPGRSPRLIDALASLGGLSTGFAIGVVGVALVGLPILSPSRLNRPPAHSQESSTVTRLRPPDFDT
jgi:VanZ family protein